MGILHIFPCLIYIWSLWKKLLAIFLLHSSFGILLRCFRYPGGIGTDIGNQADGSFALDLNAFIKLLGKHHGLFCGKSKFPGCFLLKRTGCKRWRRIASPGALPDPFHPEGSLFHFREDFIHFLLCPGLQLFIPDTI